MGADAPGTWLRCAPLISAKQSRWKCSRFVPVLTLTNRFQLRLRRETREMPVYAITIGRTMPKLTVSKHDEEGMSRVPGGGLRLDFRRTSLARQLDRIQPQHRLGGLSKLISDEIDGATRRDRTGDLLITN